MNMTTPNETPKTAEPDSPAVHTSDERNPLETHVAAALFYGAVCELLAPGQKWISIDGDSVLVDWYPEGPKHLIGQRYMSARVPLDDVLADAEDCASKLARDFLTHAGVYPQKIITPT